jgi:hypothetical protein
LINGPVEKEMPVPRQAFAGMRRGDRRPTGRPRRARGLGMEVIGIRRNPDRPTPPRQQ